MKKIFSIAFAVVLTMSLTSFGQPVNSYTFTSTWGGSYIDIGDGDTVAAVCTNTIRGGTMDDEVYSNNSLPFNFRFNGIFYNNVVICSNGFVTFGATLPSTASNYRAISGTGGYDGAIAPYSSDMWGVKMVPGTRTNGSNVITGVHDFYLIGLEVGQFITGTGIPGTEDAPITKIVAIDGEAQTITLSENATENSNTMMKVGIGKISRATTGFIGSRIHTIQFKGCQNYSVTDFNYSEFQIKLYEGSNIVEIVYGGSSATNTIAYSGQVGLRGSTNADFNNRSGAPGDFQWIATLPGISNVATLLINSSFRPIGGLRFKWTPPVLANVDVGITASSLLNGKLYSPGKCYNFTATVTNNGYDILNSVPVYYRVDGGSPVGPVNTVGPIISGASENVTFDGNNALCFLTSGNHTISIYTDLQPVPPSLNRPPHEVIVPVPAKIDLFPYTENFTNGDGWTVLTTTPKGNVEPWYIQNCVNPDGENGWAAISDFRGGENSVGRVSILRSPVLDFSSLTNPVLNFYVAYRSYFGGELDRIEVLVSTDGGLTFVPASTPYNKTRDTDPSLATLENSTTFTPFVPSGQTDWRHETVDLSNVAGNGNVVIGWRATSDYGNNAWIDNVIISDVNSLCTDAVTSTGVYGCDVNVSLNFTAIPLPPINNGFVSDNIIQKSFSKSDIRTGIPFPGFTGEESSISYQTTDNPNGGTAFISKYADINPGQSINPNIGGTEATAPDGMVYDPGQVYHDMWFTITYDGNDLTGYATYDISIDYGSLFFTNPDQLYIVKRTDRTGNWTCLNTTRAGTVLTAVGLTDFSDFALAGSDALPVELASFVSTINGRNVTLNWSTASELNNAGFDVERKSTTGEWTKIANVAGNGTSNDAHNYSFTDRNVESGKYKYRLKQNDFNGNFTYYNLSTEVNIGVPEKFELSQNYPNPFNPSTTINYDLPFDSKVSIKLFDMSGREVASLVNETKVTGYYSVNFNASSLSSGVYFYRISAEGNGQNFVATRKMMLVK